MVYKMEPIRAVLFFLEAVQGTARVIYIPQLWSTHQLQPRLIEGAGSEEGAEWLLS